MSHPSARLAAGAFWAIWPWMSQAAGKVAPGAVWGAGTVSGLIQGGPEMSVDDLGDLALVVAAQAEKGARWNRHVVCRNGERPLDGVRGFAFGLHKSAFVFAFGADFDRLRARRDFHDATKLMNRAVFAVRADLQGVAV